MHLYSSCHGSEVGEAYELDEPHLAACLLQSQMAQWLHACSTCDDQTKGIKNHSQIKD